MSHPDRPEVRRPSLFFRQPNRAEPSSHKMGWMNLFAWKGELLEALNNSVFVTDGASVGEHLQACLMDSPCQKPKKLNPIIHIVIRSVETLQPVASLVSAVIIWHRCPLLWLFLTCGVECCCLTLEHWCFQTFVVWLLKSHKHCCCRCFIHYLPVRNWGCQLDFKAY